IWGKDGGSLRNSDETQPEKPSAYPGIHSPSSPGGEINSALSSRRAIISESVLGAERSRNPTAADTSLVVPADGGAGRYGGVSSKPCCSARPRATGLAQIPSSPRSSRTARSNTWTL